MIFKNIDVEEALRKEREKLTPKPEERLLSEARNILNRAARGEYRILRNVKQSKAANPTTVIAGKLNEDNIFSLAEIHSICSRYRLRFLSSKHFKGELPYEAISKIKAFEKAHSTTLKEFKIIAPARLFRLSDRYEDPVLMIPLGEGKYYLIHKWGKDLAWYRSALYYPFRSYRALTATAILLSGVLAAIIPSGWLVRHEMLMPYIGYYRLLFFVTCFVWVAVIAIYYGLVAHKDFSESEWDSEYFN